MKPSISKKLDMLRTRIAELDHLLSHENVTANLDNYRKLTREHAEITPVVNVYEEYRKVAADIATAQELLDNPEMKKFDEGEIRTGKEKLNQFEEELQRLLLPQDPNDERNIFLEIRAGTGGDESALFAGDLFRMYSRFGERKR